MHTTHLKKTMKFKCIWYVRTTNIIPYKTLEVWLQHSSYFTPSVATVIYIWQWKLRTDCGILRVFCFFFIYCAFTSQIRYSCSSTLLWLQVKEIKIKPPKLWILEWDHCILTMSALTGDCLDWICRMEAAQCQLLLIPVVWLLPDVLPNSAVPAKHGNQTYKNSLIKHTLFPLVLGTTITSHDTSC